MRQAGEWMGWVVAGAMIVASLSACDHLTGAYGPRSEQNPLIVRFEARPASTLEKRGPFELMALASGVGMMAFNWRTSAGWLSVASESVPVASDSLATSYSAYLPPRTPGIYEVFLTVKDGGGGTFQRVARFQVDGDGARILSPQPAGIPWPPGIVILERRESH
ncbi:hypothetical protein J7643_09215 [bacterium]|nr:hypothetical protein [bacterium]